MTNTAQFNWAKAQDERYPAHFNMHPRNPIPAVQTRATTSYPLSLLIFKPYLHPTFHSSLRPLQPRAEAKAALASPLKGVSPNQMGRLIFRASQLGSL